MSEKRVIMVTGAAGLIGSAVYRLLDARGTPTLPVDQSAGGADHPQIEICDVTDIHRLHALGFQYDIGGIIHCGAFSGPMVERDNPYAIVQVNIGGTANVLELARIHNVARFVLCSSASVYGATPGPPVPEDIVLNPTSVYGASKVAGEQLVSTYSRQYDVDGVSVRLAWVYGPRRSTDCVIRTMVEDALDNRPTRIPFGKDFFRQFIHVDDAAMSLIAALDRPKLPRHTYTVTGGTYVTLGEIAEIVREIFPHADIQLECGPDPVDDLQHRFDISAAERDLGFTPRFGLKDGIRDYAYWLDNRRSVAA